MNQTLIGLVGIVAFFIGFTIGVAKGASKMIKDILTCLYTRWNWTMSDVVELMEDCKNVTEDEVKKMKFPKYL